MQMKLATAALLGFVLVAVSACLGGGTQTDPPEPLQYDDLSGGEILTPGTYRLVGAPDAFLEALGDTEEITVGAPDSERSVAGLGLRCVTDSASNCSVTIHANESFTIEGTIAVVSAGDDFPMTAAEKQIAAAEERARVAERKRLEAEREAEQARQEAEEAEEAEQAAEEARQEEEEKRQAAEAERNRLAAEAEKRQKAADTERARVAITGARTLGAAPVVPDDSIEHGAAAPVTTPVGPFTTTTGRSGRWSTTMHTANREATHHTIEIYSDVEAPKREPFATSDYNPGNAVIDSLGKVIGHVDITTAVHSGVAASGAFPRDSGPAEPFRLVDRGLDESTYDGLSLVADGSATDDELAATDSGRGITRAQYNQYRADRGFRDTDRYPERYAYTTSGTLQGAGGTYRCSGASVTVACTVQNQGDTFAFDGDWDFIPSSGTVQILVPDAQYMWFGWWAQRTVEHSETTPEHTADIWAFQANHGGTHPVSDLSAATGSAVIYRGPAAGHYAIYEPDTGDSSIGSFTASATLQADFDATTNTVFGTITGFSNDPGWSLDLKRKDISGGTIAAVADSDSVTWTIDSVPDDSGDWEAQFYNNLDTNGTVTYQPHGIAGTFEAAYDPSGAGARAALIGGFGAHR